MSKITINRLTNANVYVNGNSMLGRAEEISLPDVKFMFAEHKALGMVGKTEFPSGIDKMEAKVKWNSFYSDVFQKFANPFTALSVMVRGSIENYTSGGKTGEVPFVAIINGQPKNFPAGNFKQHENAEFESQMTVTYLRVDVAGVTITEIDILANIFKVNGVDLLADYKTNVGA